MTTICTIAEDELQTLVRLHNSSVPRDPETVSGLVDWRRQALDATWVLAERDRRPVGEGVAIHGWHSQPGIGRARLSVLAQHRGHGAGSAVLSALGAWLAERGCAKADVPVWEDDAASLAWAERRGYAEIGRSSTLALDLTGIESPRVSPPAGIEIVAWSERPGLEEGMYAVYREASPDVPGEAEAEIAPLAVWLANDMQGASDSPECVFVALAGGEVVGYAKLSIHRGERDVAWHDLTGVLRSWRTGDRGRAQARRDRLGEEARLLDAEDAERGAQRADQAAQRAPRVRRRARHDRRPRARVSPAGHVWATARRVSPRSDQERETERVTFIEDLRLAARS